MQAIRATQAERIIVTHGSIPVMVRWLQQNGWQAGGFDTEYGDDEADDGADAGPSAPLEAAPHA
jgi:putative mRNA 3-end processing factor